MTRCKGVGPMPLCPRQKEGDFECDHKGAGPTSLHSNKKLKNPKRLSTKGLGGHLCAEHRLGTHRVHNLRWSDLHRKLCHGSCRG